MKRRKWPNVIFVIKLFQPKAIEILISRINILGIHLNQMTKLIFANSAKKWCHMDIKLTFTKLTEMEISIVPNVARNLITLIMVGLHFCAYVYFDHQLCAKQQLRRVFSYN